MHIPRMQSIPAVGLVSIHIQLLVAGHTPDVCGDAVLWKPSSLTPLISVAAQQIFQEVTAGTDATSFASPSGTGGRVSAAP